MTAAGLAVLVRLSGSQAKLCSMFSPHLVLFECNFENCIALEQLHHSRQCIE
jgi:hypothetical protein